MSALKPYANNARTHSEKQIAQIAASIETFGFNNPILIDGENGVIAGHGRVEAAKKLNLKHVPVVRLEHMSDAEKRAYILADNKLAEKAGWDEGILKIELGDLIEFETDFDLDITGFETPEIDLILGDGFDPSESADPDDQFEDQVEDAVLVTQPGDLWILGHHRLLCADSCNSVSYQQVMNGDMAQVVFTDPPYNVPVNGHVAGLGSKKHREFAMASGEMTSSGFEGFLGSVFDHLVKHSADGSIHFVCMDWRHIGELDRAAKAANLETKNICVWVKPNGGMGSLYRSRHEFAFVFKSGAGPHINNVELGKHGRNRTNVWEYAGINSFGKTRDAALDAHPTVKPISLVGDALKDCSKRRDVVLDPFGGSGTSLMAAERTGRHARLIEIDPAYCDVTIRRWKNMTDRQAVHQKTGKTFVEVDRMRNQDIGEDEWLK